MAKKVSLPKSDSVGNIISETGVVEHGGVRTTPQGARHGNVESRMGAEVPFPLVDHHCLEAQDANDGTEDGNQPSFSMPSFANGRDLRHRG